MGTLAVEVLAFIVIILVVVGVHEGGHFAVAKWSGIRVDEFSIGFGPKLLSRRRGETLYALRAIPVGGYVKMPGTSSLDQEDGGERAFRHASLPRRLATIVAGVTVNFIFAGLVFTVLALPGQTATVQPGGALAAAGLRDGDVILSIDGRSIDLSDPVRQTDQLHAATRDSQGGPLHLMYRRGSDGATATLVVNPLLVLDDANAPGDGLQPHTVVETVNGSPVGRGRPVDLLGNGATVRVTGRTLAADAKPLSGTVGGVVDADTATGQDRVAAAWRLGLAGPSLDGASLPQAVRLGFGAIPGAVGLTLKTLWQAVAQPSSGAINNFQGPIGIAHDTAAATEAGWLAFLNLMGAVSLGLGIINVLPIPPFDGGRLALILAEAASRRTMEPRRELAFVVAGMMLLLTLFAFITVNDIKGFSAP